MQKYSSSESYCDCFPYERRNLSLLDALAKNTQRRRIIIFLSKHQPNIIIIIRCRFAGKTLAGYCSDLQFVVPFVPGRRCWLVGALLLAFLPSTLLHHKDIISLFASCASLLRICWSTYSGAPCVSLATSRSMRMLSSARTYSTHWALIFYFQQNQETNSPCHPRRFVISFVFLPPCHVMSLYSFTE